MNNRRLKYILVILVFITLIFYVVKTKIIEYWDINKEKLFSENVGFYIDKPFKKLLLDINYPIVDFNFNTEHSKLKGVYITFSTNQTVLIKFKKIKHEKELKSLYNWDLNKLILEDIDDIKLVFLNPDLERLEKDLEIRLVTNDSIVVTPHYHFSKTDVWTPDQKYYETGRNQH